MRVLNAGYEIIQEPDSIKKIERIARLCYKSEDKITEGSAARMVKFLVHRKHTAMLEHASFIMSLDMSAYECLSSYVTELREMYGVPVYLRFTDPCCGSEFYLVSGNMRAWLEFVENCVEHDIPVLEVVLKHISSEQFNPIFDAVIPQISRINNIGCEYRVERDLFNPIEKQVHIDQSVKFIVDRGISHEIVRHRPASFAQESTRYCNYGGDGITVIKPCYMDEGSIKYKLWRTICEYAEDAYIALLGAGAKPEEARAVLPNSLKTEVVMTANLREWRYFFCLRALGTTGKPHPQMVEVALPLLKEVKEKIPVVFDDLVIKEG